MGYSREDYPEYADWITAIFQPKPSSPCAMEEYDSATGLIAAVEAGRGVALVSASVVPDRPAGEITANLPGLGTDRGRGALAADRISALTKTFIVTARKAASAV